VSRYLSITVVQEPTDVGTDTNNRSMFAFNVDATVAYPIDKFEEEIARLIFDAGLGAVGSSLFIGSAAVLPTIAGPFISIIRTSGYGPLETHNSDKYQRPSCQVVVRALGYVVARTRAVAIWQVLDGVRNTTITAA
jgi:hypothetical protein